MALAFTCVCGGCKAGDYGVYTGGEFSGKVWVSSGNVTPLSCGVSDGVVSEPASFIESSSWGWLKSALGLENLQALC